jgi:glucose-6-phosphate isomerase
MTHPYAQDLRHCFPAQSGPHALGHEAFEAQRAALQPHLAALRASAAAGRQPLYEIVKRRDDLAAAAPVVAHLLKNTTDLCLLGVGGSGLGAQAVAQLKGWRTPGVMDRVGDLRFHVFDNLDGASFAHALATFDLRTTRFLVVSKSGSTGETMMQALAAVEALKAGGGGKYLAQHFAVLTEPTENNPARQFAAEIGAPVLDHPLDIGGRYSVLTLVGLLPALLLGLDATAIRDGALAVWERVLTADDAEPVVGAALAIAAAEAGFGELVLMPYGDRFDRFGAWWRQLWAESVGKDGKGQAASTALGPVDQHSQLQLYLGGPNVRAFTVMSAAQGGEGLRPDPAFAEKLGVGYLGGHLLGDLVAAQTRATAETLARRGRPVRTMTVETLDERSLGALFMHFMLETILAARLMEVDPLDQPAVEEGKKLARAYLAQSKA